jgi:hypothetical protein
VKKATYIEELLEIGLKSSSEIKEEDDPIKEEEEEDVF